MTEGIFEQESLSSEQGSNFSLGSEEWILLCAVVIAVGIGLVLNSALGDHVQHPGLWIFGALFAAAVAVAAVILGVFVERRAERRERDMLARLDKVRQEDNPTSRL
jgi:hypothetical protein